MDALDLLLTRRSVVAKNLGEPGPSAEQLEQILTAGIRVPDHGKIGPWRIQVLDKQGQAALGDILADLYLQDNPETEERLVEIERERPQRCPILLIVTAKIDPHHPKIPALEQRLSGGAVCQNLLLAAHATGFAAQWLTQWPAFDARVLKALGHGEDADMIGMIYIGTPTEPPAERNRATLDQVVSHWTGPASA